MPAERVGQSAAARISLGPSMRGITVDNRGMVGVSGRGARHKSKRRQRRRLGGATLKAARVTVGHGSVAVGGWRVKRGAATVMHGGRPRNAVD